MKKIMSLVIVLLVILLLLFIFCTNNNKDENNIKTENNINTENNVKLQVIEFNSMENTEQLVKEVEIKVGDVIELKEFYGNNVKILEINDKNIKISREALRYEILSQTSLYEGELREYTETVVDTVEYNTLIAIDIDSSHPFGPDMVQRMTYYKIKFVK